ncbi:MAG: tetratricopeptide repeat protein [Candidatus Lokiarchaeia archaeon]
MSSSELEYEEALFLYERGLELVEREDWQEALSRFKSALDIFEKVGSDLEISLCLKALGKIYGYLGRWLKATEYFEKDLEIQKRMGNEQELMEDIDNLITYYRKSFNFEKAITQLEHIHNIFEKSKNQEKMAHIEGYLGQIYENMGDLDQALTHYKLAFDLGEKLDLPNTIKLDTKIRELTNWKKSGKQTLTTLDEMQLSQFGIRTLGGVKAEPQMEHYAEVLSDLDELSKEKLLREKEESKSTREKVWVPSREIPREELKIYLDIIYRETLEINNEQVLTVVFGEVKSGSGETDLSRSYMKEKIGSSPVQVLVLAPDFDISESLERFEIFLEKGSRALQFKLTPRKVGKCQISLEFYHLGRMLQRTVRTVFVKEESEEVFNARKRIELSLYSDSDLDATLRVQHAENRFYFYLFSRHADDLYSRGEVFGVSELDALTSERLQLQMRNLTFDREHPQRAITILTEIGRKTYSLIPEGIRETISFLNPRYLIIETEDLFMPFELAYDGEDFLCLKYCLGKRILNGNRNFMALPASVEGEKLRTKLIIAEPEEEKEIPEKEFLKSVGASGLLILDEVMEKADRRSLIESLSESVDVVHLRCQGVFNEKEPTESKLLLSDGLFQLKEIENINIQGHPLIFADIREESTDQKKTGAQGFTGIAAIAKTFLNSGASALIGPVFRIPDHLISEIVLKFYEKIIVNGKPLGLIMREIKKELKQKYPGVLWATFNLYGDPTLKLTTKKQ